MSKRQQTAAAIIYCNDPEPIRLESEQVQSRIRDRAFELSLSRGHDGREVDDWLSAESEIISMPPLELSEKDNGYVIRMGVLGIRPGSLKVMVTSDQALVKGELWHDHEPDAAIHWCEFRSVSLFRIVPFPSGIEPRSVRAEVKDGLLRITALKQGRKKKAARPKATRRTVKKAPPKASRSAKRS